MRNEYPVRNNPLSPPDKYYILCYKWVIIFQIFYLTLRHCLILSQNVRNICNSSSNLKFLLSSQNISASLLESSLTPSRRFFRSSMSVSTSCRRSWMHACQLLSIVFSKPSGHRTINVPNKWHLLNVTYS